MSDTLSIPKYKEYKMKCDPIVAKYYTQSKQYTGDTGIDLYIGEDVTIDAFETKLVPLYVYCEPCDGLAYELRCRSSIYKTPIRLCNAVGTVDANYRGMIMATVDNIKDKPYTIEKGTRLFQLVDGIGRPSQYTIVDELSQTNRGEKGFGSTGK